jgi:hypothetical protein
MTKAWPTFTTLACSPGIDLTNPEAEGAMVSPGCELPPASSRVTQNYKKEKEKKYILEPAIVLHTHGPSYLRS